MLHSGHPPSGATALKAMPDSSRLIKTEVSDSNSAMPFDYERFEYRDILLFSYQLERSLLEQPLVSDCAVIAVPQQGGVISVSGPSVPLLSGNTPTAFVVLNSTGRDRASKGGEKESRRMKSELLKSLFDSAPAFKQMNGRLLLVDCIPRSSNDALNKDALIDKATSAIAPPVPGPSKGFFTTVLSESLATKSKKAHPEAEPPKKTARDSKRRATHSQIERRRREKINDRLITLRSIVPACAKELQDRHQQRQDEANEAARIAAGGAPKTVIDAATGKPKRKRNRKKPDTAKKATTGVGTEEELGLHKLEVLTHAINHIYELKAHIYYLETGVKMEHIPTAEDPSGTMNHVTIKDEIEDDSRPSTTAFSNSRVFHSQHPGINAQEDHEDEDEEDEFDDDDDEDYNFVGRLVKKHNNGGVQTSRLRQGRQPHLAGSTARRRRPDQSSSSSRDSEDVSPSFPLEHSQYPSTGVSSPLMSLSAESPIFLSEPAAVSKPRSSLTGSFSALPSSALPFPSQQPPSSMDLERRESGSSLFKQLSLTSPNVGPFNPTAYSTAVAAARSRSSTLSFPSYGAESEMRETSSLPSADPLDASAAALLLNFSTSPEVLRPVGSTRSNSHSRNTSIHQPRPVVGLGSRGSSRSLFTSPQYRPWNGEPQYSCSAYFNNPRSAGFRVPASAPGGASAVEKQEAIEELDLGSPSHLVLDASPESASARDDFDRVSDATLEDIQLTS